MSKKKAASDKSKKKSRAAKAAGQPASPTECAEHGVWTDVTQVKHPPAGHQPLQFSRVDPDENERILSSGKMSFAMVGCSGDPMIGTHTQEAGGVSPRFLSCAYTAN